MADEKMKKVKECYNHSEMYQCQRCKDEAEADGWYCDCCNPEQTVEFELSEELVNWKGEKTGVVMDWKGEKVCPYCFNQLIDIKNKEELE